MARGDRCVASEQVRGVPPPKNCSSRGTVGRAATPLDRPRCCDLLPARTRQGGGGMRRVASRLGRSTTISTRCDHRSFFLLFFFFFSRFYRVETFELARIGKGGMDPLLKSRRRSLRHLCVRRSNSSSRTAIRGNVDTAIRHEMVSLSPVVTGFDFKGMRSSTKMRFVSR